METKSPIYAQAKEFAEGVHAVYPEKWLAYNVSDGIARILLRSLADVFFTQLSPSFNWSAAGLDEQQMKSYVWDLGKLGFVWQFITVSRFRALSRTSRPRADSSSYTARRSPLERLHL